MKQQLIDCIQERINEVEKLLRQLVAAKHLLKMDRIRLEKLEQEEKNEKK